ncbi:MAG: C45 family autoproteolytic acyltransferase/hydrolase [Planctomycetota bacterium]
MTQSLPILRLQGSSEDAGYQHGMALRSYLATPFRNAYLDRLGPITRTRRDDLERQAERWLRRLPDHIQREIDGMATGAGVTTSAVTTFLYADIARSTPTEEPTTTIHEQIVGPMCSAACVRERRSPWIARNCDWISATLMRGVCGVMHAIPNRIPILAVGIRGDIDVDTGLNAEGLWLHLHTMPAMDDPPRDRTMISWLFWAREALETCANLDDLDRFIETTTRDRGVLVIAAHGPTETAAIFECQRGTHRRFDQTDAAMAVTNHPIDKPIDDDRAQRARAGSTVSRFCGLRSKLRQSPPSTFPDDLCKLLAAPDIEMRHAKYLRTIYSAVVQPRTQELWFAAGDEHGRPAASTGQWRRVPVDWP